MRKPLIAAALGLTLIAAPAQAVQNPSPGYLVGSTQAPHRREME